MFVCVACACECVLQLHVCGRVSVNHMPNFSLIGSLINSWRLKQLTLGVSITKQHLRVVTNARPYTWTPHAKFQFY